MDQEQTFYQQPVDQTPYFAFIWVIFVALAITALIGFSLWQAGSWTKSQRWFSGRSTTVTLPANSVDDDILQQAKDAAANAAQDSAQKAVNAAAAQATQELLNQRDAAVQAAGDAAADAAQDQVQQYLGQ